MKILPLIIRSLFLVGFPYKKQDESSGSRTILHLKKLTSGIVVNSANHFFTYDLCSLANSNLILPLIFFKNATIRN
jgi:hypothetical protein